MEVKTLSARSVIDKGVKFELLSSSDLLNVVQLKEFCLTLKPSSRAHYHNLSAWGRVVSEHIHQHLGNIRPGRNMLRQSDKLWLVIYSVYCKICWSPNMYEKVARHHCSAMARNEALKIELEWLIRQIIMHQPATG